MKNYRSRFLVVLASVMITACAINPVTGKKQFSLMSEAQEIAMGKESDPAIIAQYGLYDNEELQQFINEKGKEMASISHRPELDFNFRILDSDVVNAFAVPGGYVYFTRGIMAYFNDEAQFAGVLGHEIGHVTARHSAQQYTKQMITQLAFMGGMIASERFRGFAQEAMQGMELLFLKFSRTDESEADKLGVYYSSQVGYDAHEMGDFFQTLDRLSGGDEGRLPEFMSTHPDPGRRYQNVHEMATEYQEGSAVNFEVNRDGYLRMIDGIVYGPDPRQGYVDDGKFFQPEMKFEYPVPTGWQLMNSPSQVQMAPEDGKALIVLMLTEESNLSTAASAIREKYSLTNVSGGATTINGLSAWRMVGDYPQQDPYSGETSYLKMQTLLIRYGDNTYLFHGLCERDDYNTYRPRFDQTMNGFRKLTDPSRMNVLPERIHIVEVTDPGTLRQVLSRDGVPADRMDELAILNGMETDAPLKRGDLVKSIRK